MKNSAINEEDLETYVHKIHDELDLTKAEKYFLTRLVFEHVDSADYAELISRDFGDRGLLDLSIRIKDSSNKSFTIRPAFHPKEIAHFHRLLIESKLDVQFEPSHKFLLIFNDKNILIGGVFWKKTSKNVSHLEKGALTGDVSCDMLKSININSVIVGHSERRTIFKENDDILLKKIELCVKNNFEIFLSVKLIEELYQRLKIKKFKYVTVGFFKSELFYKLGFEINQKFGGLVKRL